jgi:hypothetical protein
MQGDGLRIEGPDNSTLIENGAGAVLLDRKSKQAARVPTSGNERVKVTHPERVKMTHLGLQNSRSGQER